MISKSFWPLASSQGLARGAGIVFGQAPTLWPLPWAAPVLSQDTWWLQASPERPPWWIVSSEAVLSISIKSATKKCSAWPDNTIKHNIKKHHKNENQFEIWKRHLLNMWQPMLAYIVRPSASVGFLVKFEGQQTFNAWQSRILRVHGKAGGVIRELKRSVNQTVEQMCTKFREEGFGQFTTFSCHYPVGGQGFL